ncbi:hypothetical protein QJS66_13150 [Kocuria rhizophila]|nr:hypothetical protein QJS66_13150 [Kocuria rhizophila]
MTETRSGAAPRLSILVPAPLLIAGDHESAANRNRSPHEWMSHAAERRRACR